MAHLILIELRHLDRLIHRLSCRAILLWLSCKCKIFLRSVRWLKLRHKSTCVRSSVKIMCWIKDRLLSNLDRKKNRERHFRLFWFWINTKTMVFVVNNYWDKTKAPALKDCCFPILVILLINVLLIK